VLGNLEGQYYIAGTPRISQPLAGEMRADRVSGVSIAVIDDYRISWTSAAGFRDVSGKAPVTENTLFQAASMSKAVAAAGILRLFEVKHLSLDADVNTLLRSWHVPMVPNVSGTVTMRRLLSHNAGVNVHGFQGYDRDATLPTLLQVLDGSSPATSEAIRVTSVPGSKTEYSGGGTTIAQQVAIDLSGEPFATFMQQTVLAPLNMRASTFDQPLPTASQANAANGYYSDGKAVHRGWHVYPTMAAAGLWTTPTDLASFVIAIQDALRGRGKPPIDATVAREMTTKASQIFALGPAVGSGFFWHDGANEGFQGTFIGLTTGGRGVVVMTNSDNGILLANEIVHSVARVYRWPVLQPEPKTALSLKQAQMRSVTGSYVAKASGFDVSMQVTIERNAGASALFLRSSLDKIPTKLYAEGPLRFFTLNGASLVFVRDAAGHAISLQTAGMTLRRRPGP
jgi:CubicO group peptidase (beta-lactamase class C family)